MWEPLVSCLPPWLQSEIQSLPREKISELRLRTGLPAEIVLSGGPVYLNRRIVENDISHCINAASQYSPWTAVTISRGYLTVSGGHRIGLCGEAIIREGQIVGMRKIRSICIRVAKDITGIVDGSKISGSILILGAPGWGKTTLLRDLIRCRSGTETVAVVDERGELFPEGFQQGKRMDVLTGVPKEHGIEMLLRTMGPDCIAVDEITAEVDCHMLIRASGCGICLLATAHASSLADFYSRPVYRILAEQKIFDSVILLRKDKSYHMERMMQ